MSARAVPNNVVFAFWARALSCTVPRSQRRTQVLNSTKRCSFAEGTGRWQQRAGPAVVKGNKTDHRYMCTEMQT